MIGYSKQATDNWISGIKHAKDGQRNDIHRLSRRQLERQVKMLETFTHKDTRISNVQRGRTQGKSICSDTRPLPWHAAKTGILAYIQIDIAEFWLLAMVDHESS